MNERWRAELILRWPRLAEQIGWSWLDLCNRRERLRQDATTGGRECLWPDSSSLTVARIFPDVGGRLLRHVLKTWPVAFDFAEGRAPAANPQVSILIPIGGTNRVSQFELALAAARAQVGVDVEVIVVEQAEQPSLAGRLPSDVRYVFQQGGAPIGGFNKSWALNRGAHEALGDCLILLDADYLLPRQFAGECWRTLQDSEAARPSRMIFYLDEAASIELASLRNPGDLSSVEAVVANNPTPIAICRRNYWAIGGHDEAYVGWGGEDTEFLDRLRTRHLSEAGWMPVLHAWHAPAAKKSDGDRNRQLHMRRMSVPTATRIQRLLGVSGGQDHPRAWQFDDDPPTTSRAAVAAP